MPIFANYAPVVVQALQARGLTGECPMCKEKSVGYPRCTGLHAGV